MLRPLDMRASVGAIAGEARARLVSSYLPSDDDRPYPRGGALAAASPLVITSAAGCVAATPSDMVSYMHMLAHGGQGPSGALISRAAFEAFSTPFVHAPDFGPTAHYCYGIAIDTLDGDRVLRHTGGMVSFMSSIQVNLDGGHGAFASINAQQGYRPNRITRYALQLLRADQRRQASPPVPSEEENELPDVAELSATYTASDGRRLKVAVQDRRVVLVSGDRRATVQHLGGDAFLAVAPEWALYPLVFKRGSDAAEGASVSRIVGMGYGADWFARGDTAPEPAAPAANLRPFEGTYYSADPWVGTVRIVARRGRLWLNGMTPLQPVGALEFRFANEPSSPEIVEFSAIVLDQAQRLCINGNYLERVLLPG